jgi:serine-type D-Ala-D-Ala carboxypeptidase (penicillin-binding protein 5/6)
VQPVSRTRRRALGLVAAGGLALALVPVALVPAAGAAAAAPVGGPLLASSGVVVAPGATPPPDVGSSWVVADMDTGAIYGAKAPHAQLRPASTLKTLTALTLLPLLDPTSVYTATAADTRMEGTRVGMIAGTTYTVDQLFQGMLLPSANDAAHGLEMVEGGPTKTIALMTAEAQHLQAFDTTVKDPSGLDQPGQYSSAYDLALFARAAMALPAFRAYVITSHATFPGQMSKTPGKPRSTFVIDNKNRLLLDGYPGMIGIKTGYTSKAGNTFIGAATRGGHTVLVTLMHTKGVGETAERKLMDWAFTNYGKAGTVGQLVDPVVAASAAPKAVSVTPLRTPASAGSPGASAGSLLMWVVGAAGAAALALAGAAVMRSSRRRRRMVSPLGLAPIRRR